MDLTVLIVVEALLTSFIVYLALNSYFHFHVSLHRTNAISVVLIIATLLLMIEDLTLFEGIYAFVLIAVLKVVLDFIGTKRKTKGYVLLNVWKKDYIITKEFFKNALEKNQLDSSKMCYRPQKPFLIVFEGLETKLVKKIMTEFDKVFHKLPKRFTTWHYLTFLGSLLLIIIIWRF